VERTSDPLSGYTATADRGGFHPGTPGRIPFTWRAVFGWIAVLAALLGLVTYLGFLGIPSYLVKIQGLPRDPGAAFSPTYVRALPTTPIRIDAFPRRFALRKVELALYREAGKELERIDDESVRRLPTGFGAVAFEARAADLVAGPAPGLHRIYLVVAPAGRLPRRVDFVPGERLKTALSGRSVTTLQIDMLADGG
jgi:hypothetical protein